MLELKAILEQRSKLLGEMKELAAGLTKQTADGKIEARAFTDEEQRSYDEKYAEVERLNSTIASLNKEQRDAGINVPAEDGVSESDSGKTAAEKKKNEERAFVEHLRCGKAMNVEVRADGTMTMNANGDVIPETITDKIIEQVEAISPVFSLATKYTIGGTLNIPYYDESEGAITMAYADEFAELENSSGKFGSIQLGGHLAGALCKVSKRLINNSKFNILNFVLKKIAQSAARFIEGEIFSESKDKIEGLASIKQIVPASAATAITADELIDVQEEVPDEYQANSIWVMSRNTRKAIRKLKDGDGNYLLQKDATAKWGYTLFGKDVYVSSKVPDMAAGKLAIFYGDFAGLAIKISEYPTVEVLREKYSTQHVVGVIAWLEMDSKIENAQMLAALRMAA